MVSRGYRDPLTFKKAPLTEGLSITNHLMNMDKLSNAERHQYLYELMRGQDPRRSSWYRGKEHRNTGPQVD